MLLNSQEVTEEIKMGIKKYLETNESKKKQTKKKTIQNLQDAVNAMLKGNFI